MCWQETQHCIGFQLSRGRAGHFAALGQLHQGNLLPNAGLWTFLREADKSEVCNDLMVCSCSVEKRGELQAPKESW